MSMQNLPSWLPSEFEGRFQSTSGSGAVKKELARWQELCRELLAERERMRAELAQVREERDQYIQRVYYLIREDVPFTREEVFASLGKSPSIEDWIKKFRGELEEDDKSDASPCLLIQFPSV